MKRTVNNKVEEAERFPQTLLNDDTATKLKAVREAKKFYSGNPTDFLPSKNKAKKRQLKGAVYDLAEQPLF